MQTPIAAYIARAAIEDPERFARTREAPKQVETSRPVRRRFALALRRSADRLAPLTD
jgi:hypothetical protein